MRVDGKTVKYLSIDRNLLNKIFGIKEIKKSKLNGSFEQWMRVQTASNERWECRNTIWAIWLSLMKYLYWKKFNYIRTLR